MHLPSQVTSIFHERRYYGWQSSIVGGDPLEGRLVNSQVPEVAIYLHMYLGMYLCASFHCSRVNHLRVFRISVTKLVWQRWFAAKPVHHLQMVGHLKCIARWCIKSFGGQKGGLSKPPQTPHAYRPAQRINLWLMDAGRCTPSYRDPQRTYTRSNR